MAVSMPSGSTPQRSPSAFWLLIPLILLALVAGALGAFASQTIKPIEKPAYFQLFFSSVIAMKVWLTTAAVILAVLQVITATRIYGLLRLPPEGRFYNFMHRTTGFLAIGLSLPVAYHCIFLLGYASISDTRTLIHAILGTFVYGVFVAKVFVVVFPSRFGGWVLPILGSLLFTILLGLWVTSSLWFFSNAGVFL
ncbi:MAG TPA: DUF6529 family protein [Ktedonobacterales bacterium]|jgi:uncharacterized protein DUF6529|nr:DUF6529 family protein [Ktedonobacterales bacterium]